MYKRLLIALMLVALTLPMTATHAQTDCPVDFSGFAPIRLTPNGLGEVMPGSPNRVRTAPTGDGDIITEMPAGTTFTVLEGRSCADGIVWLEVEVDGQRGWTAESVDGQYYLQRAASQVMQLPQLPPLPDTAVTMPDVIFNNGAYQIKSSGMGVLIAAATGTTDLVDLWDIDTGTYYEMTFDGAGNIMYFMEDAAEESFLTVNTEGGVGFWDVMFAADGDPIPSAVLATQPIAYATSPDFTQIAVGGCFAEAAASGCTEGVVNVYTIADRSLAYSITHPDGVTAIAYSADGTELATADTSGTIYLWNGADGTGVANIPLGPTTVSDLAFDPVGDLLAAGWCEVYQGESCQIGSVALFTRSNAKQVASYPSHNGVVNTVAFHPDGVMFASGGADGIVRVRQTLMGTDVQTYAPNNFGAVNDVIFFTDFNELGIAGENAVGIFALPE